MKKFHIGFYENRKYFFGVSLGIIFIGLIFNFIFGTQLDTQFKGGAMIKYSYTGDVEASDVESVVQKAVKRDVSVSINKNVKSATSDETFNNITLEFAGDSSLSVADQKTLTSTLTTTYPNAKFTLVSSNSVNPTMGRSFLWKCIVAVIIAFLLLDFYIALRFRKIGGTAAGVFAIVALIHDCLMVYFTFIIFRIPLNDNFIAVILTILGYSLNDTIVIYDRIRENRKLQGVKVGYDVLVDDSINETLTRSIYTAACTFASIATVYIVGSIYNLSSVTTFALPMMVGVVTGCYSSVCIAGPLYVMWEKHKASLRAQAAEKVVPAVPAAAPAPQSTVQQTSSAASAASRPAGKTKAKKRKR